MTKSHLGERELEVGADIKGKVWLESFIPEPSVGGVTAGRVWQDLG